jgi:hypothetical protein
VLGLATLGEDGGGLFGARDLTLEGGQQLKQTLLCRPEILACRRGGEALLLHQAHDGVELEGRVVGWP